MSLRKLPPDPPAVNLRADTVESARTLLRDIFIRQGDAPSVLVRLRDLYPSGGKAILSAYVEHQGQIACIDQPIMLALERPGRASGGFRQSFPRDKAPATALGDSLATALALPWRVRGVLTAAQDASHSRMDWKDDPASPRAKAFLPARRMRRFLTQGQTIHHYVARRAPASPFVHLRFLASSEKFPELGIRDITADVAELARLPVKGEPPGRGIKVRASPHGIPPEKVVISAFATRLYRAGKSFQAEPCPCISALTLADMPIETDDPEADC